VNASRLRWRVSTTRKVNTALFLFTCIQVCAA